MPDDLLGAIGALDKRAQQEPPKNELQDAINALGDRAGKPDPYGQPTAPANGPSPYDMPDMQSYEAAPPTYRSAQEEGIEPEPTQFQKVMGRLFGTDVNDPAQWTRLGTTVGGAITGSVLGGQVPGPPALKALGAAAGGMAGTVMGAAMPETTWDVMESAGLISEDTRKSLGLSREDLMTVMEGEFLLEAYTLGGVSALRLGKRGLTNLFTGANRETRALAERASREGIALLPVQVGEGRFARGFVSVMGRFPWVAGALKKKAQRSMDQISNAFNGVPERFGPLTTFDEASASILRESQNTLNGLQTHYDQVFQDILQHADTNNVTVRPVNTRAVTTRLMKQLDRELPTGIGGMRGRLPKGMDQLRTFMRQNTGILFHEGEIADQNMSQMYNLLKVIDQNMTGVGKTGDQQTLGRFEQLRQAIQLDIFNNAGPSTKLKSQQAIANASREAVTIRNRFRDADEELTYAINTLLGHATGSKLGAVVSPTLRSARFQNLGSKGIDSLAQSLIRDNSVSVVDELSRLVPQDTMRQLTGAVMNDAVQKSFINEGGNVVRFDADTFARSLGLDAPTSGKFRQTQALLQQSGGMSMDELGVLVESARRASRAEIPDVSTFVARGATMGGLRRIWNVLIPGALIGGVTATSVSSGMMLGIMTIGGSRLISRMISDPKSARALSRVLDQEVKQSIRWTAGIRAFEFGVQKLVDAGEATASEAQNMTNAYYDYIDTFRSELKQMEENGQ